MPNLPAYLASNYLVQVPVLIVWLVGIIVAVARWERHPRISLLAVIALAVFLLRALALPLLSLLAIHSPFGFARMGLIQGVLNVGAALVAAAAWILILIAIFGQRGAEIRSSEE